MILTAMLAVTLFQVPAQEWNQYRGPGGKGDASSSDLVTTWSKDSNVVWQLPVPGKAWSSPIVHQGNVWLTNATADGKKLSLVKVDLATGKMTGDYLLREVAEPQFCIPYNSYASCTPAARDGKIYAHYGSPLTACVDAASGKILWERADLKCNHHRGAGSSPLLWENLLFIIYDGFDLQYVVALDIATGKTVWKSDRGIDYGTDNGDMKKAYATPIVIRVNDREELISPTSKGCFGYDVKTGQEIWRVTYEQFSTPARPLFHEGNLIFSAGFSKGVLVSVKSGGQGDVTATHFNWKVDKAMPSKPSRVKHSSNRSAPSGPRSSTPRSAAAGSRCPAASRHRATTSVGSRTGCWSRSATVSARRSEIGRASCRERV